MAQGGERSRSGKNEQERHLSWVATISGLWEAGSHLLRGEWAGQQLSNVSLLIPSTWGYVTLHGGRDFAGAITKLEMARVAEVIQVSSM